MCADCLLFPLGEIRWLVGWLVLPGDRKGGLEQVEVRK